VNRSSLRKIRTNENIDMMRNGNFIPKLSDLLPRNLNENETMINGNDVRVPISPISIYGRPNMASLSGKVKLSHSQLMENNTVAADRYLMFSMSLFHGFNRRQINASY
jgi:hypothetical protein